MQVDVRWRPPGHDLPEATRLRLAADLRSLGWELSEMEGLVREAHQRTGLSHAYLLPRLEMGLPLFDEGRRFRVRITMLDATRTVVLDEEGREVADVRVV